jgi:hypothetical protein
MHLICDSKAKFDVKINPFTKQLQIRDRNSNEILEFFYEDIDEWGSFTVEDKVYNYHILYDSRLSFDVYPVIDGVIYFNDLVPINLSVAV